MRRQHYRGVLETFQERLKRMKNNDVRIEIQNYVAILARQKALERKTLHPGAGLHDGMLKDPLLGVWNAKLLNAHQGIERLIPQVEIQGQPIGDHQMKNAIRQMALDAVRQHTRLR